MDPFSFALAAIAFISAVGSGYSSYQQGKAEKKAYDMNAQILKQNAIQKRMESSLNEDTLRKQNRQKMAQTRANMAENGILESPTAMYALSGQSQDLEQEAQNLRYEGQTAAADLLNQSALQKYYGKSAALNGRNAFYMSFLNGAVNAATTYGAANGGFGGKK